MNPALSFLTPFPCVSLLCELIRAPASFCPHDQCFGNPSSQDPWGQLPGFLWKFPSISWLSFSLHDVFFNGEVNECRGLVWLPHFINSLTYLPASLFSAFHSLEATFLFGVSDGRTLFIFSENRDSVHHGNLISIFPFIFKGEK